MEIKHFCSIFGCLLFGAEDFDEFLVVKFAVSISREEK